MKASERIKADIEKLTARQQQIRAEQIDMKAAIEQEKKTETAAILAGEDGSAIAESIAKQSARLQANERALDLAGVQLAELKERAAEAIDVEAVADFNRDYAGYCKQLADAGEQIRSLSIFVDTLTRGFAGHLQKLNGPHARVAKSTANFYWSSLANVGKHLSNVSFYFDALHDVEEKRLEKT